MNILKIIVHKISTDYLLVEISDREKYEDLCLFKKKEKKLKFPHKNLNKAIMWQSYNEMAEISSDYSDEHVI